LFNIIIKIALGVRESRNFRKQAGGLVTVTTKKCSGKIARIANALQCHSLLSGFYNCHD